MPRRIAATLAAALVSAGCASTRAWGPPRPPQARPNAGARAEFGPPRFEELFAAAVELVRERGLAIAACHARRGALATAPVEFDAPCGGSTCLARETTRVKLGYRRARVVVTREVWDASIRAWREQGDRETDSELSRAERELLSAMVHGAASSDEAADGLNPCAPPRCRDGTCVAARTSSWP